MSTKPKHKKNTSGRLQNKHYKTVAESEINRMSYWKKKSQLRQLKEKGYEYNENLYILLDMDTEIPYEFVLFCLLKENLESKC